LVVVQCVEVLNLFSLPERNYFYTLGPVYKLVCIVGCRDWVCCFLLGPAG